MVKHVIIWKLKDGYTFAEKQNIKANAKLHLESLVGKLNGLISLRVEIAPLLTSTGDMMLVSSFVDFAALERYSTSPQHVAVADTYVRPYTAVRSCFDYEIDD